MNSITVSGRITQKPTLSHTPNGLAYTRFDVASRANGKDEEGKQKTDFFKCVAWKGLAETITKYCDKGKFVTIIGEMSSRVVTEGERPYWDCRVLNIEFGDIESGKKTAKTELTEVDRQVAMEDGNLPF